MKKLLPLLLLCLLLFSLLASCGGGAVPAAAEPSVSPVTAIPSPSPSPAPSPSPEPEEHWVGTWGCAQYYGDATGDGGKMSALTVSATLPEATLRQIIRISAGGGQLRFTFSNEYGEGPLVIRAAHIAKATVPASSDIDVATDTPLTFNGGSAEVSIPAGERAVSDPVEFPAGALERIAVTTYFGEMPATVSCHVAARGNSFIQPGVNAVSEAALSGTKNTHWFVLSGAEVLSAPEQMSVVALGDSITDGYGVTDEKYTRWTDVFAEKLQENPDTQHISVINMGIGTNTLLNQANPLAAVDRFERDVLEQPGVGYFVFLIGTNDLGGKKAEDMIASYDTMIQEAAAAGIKVFAGTVIPKSMSNDTVRQTVNEWLRQQYADGNVYGLADFDELLRDPENPNTMLKEYNNDNTHPSIAGYAAMGEYMYTLIEADIAAN
ncbi:MAG: GDSL-type esterase/lipase family protein [Oscillospiraceae bacterium]|nr:GDSL-type esterase/lipase family protein [Oscillospiraceae bacterium]